MPIPLIAGLGPEEIVLIIVVIVLLFGATKLPELARGSGRALRIFKAETKGLIDDEDSGEEGKKKSLGKSGHGEASGEQAQSDVTTSDETEHRSHPTD